jgi:predicted O-methyltransferase YrrM
VNPVLSAILRDGTVEDANGRRVPLQWNISAEEGRFLQELIRAKRPSKSIEIGCAYGISSLFICEALREVGAKSHTIIDPYQLTTVTEYSSGDGYEGIGLLNLRRAGFEDLITFYPEPSYRCLPRLEASQETFDFAFVDGMHTFDYVFTDFFYIDKMLPVGGVIVFDDVFYASVTKLCRYILTNLPYEAIGPDAKQASTLRRKLLVAMAARVRAFARLVRPDLSRTNESLGIPYPGLGLAMRKTGVDIIGESAISTRHWGDHNDF